MVQFRHYVFPVADHKRVDEIRQRFRVKGAGSAGHNNGIPFPPFPAFQRNPAHFHHGKDIAETHFVLQRKTDYIKFVQRMPAFHGKQRQLLLFHQCDHVCPGHEKTFAKAPAFTIDQPVQNFHTQMAHADFIGVREAETEVKGTFIPPLHFSIHLASCISRGLLDLFQYFFYFVIQIHIRILRILCQWIAGVQ